LDAKGRLVVPKLIRDEVADREGVATFHVGCLLEDCLYLHTEDQHLEFISALEDQLDNGEAGRRLKTQVHECFCPVTTDKTGRITVPDYLLKAAVITDRVSVVGMRERVELWPWKGVDPISDHRQNEDFRAGLELALGATSKGTSSRNGSSESD
jgi:DNA-binding transcriptional regulator/RsmH inhibitor MraZ